MESNILNQNSVHLILISPDLFQNQSREQETISHYITNITEEHPKIKITNFEFGNNLISSISKETLFRRLKSIFNTTNCDNVLIFIQTKLELDNNNNRSFILMNKTQNEVIHMSDLENLWGERDELSIRNLLVVADMEFPIFTKKGISFAGYGMFFHCKGDKYYGDYKEGRKEGNGQFKFKDGSRYDGQFFQGVANGYGVFHFKQTSDKVKPEKYEGSFKNGNFQGHGIYHYENGDKFEGNYVSGQRNGNGTYVYSDGRKVKGEYLGGVLAKIIP
jgi:hypothetical protein